MPTRPRKKSPQVYVQSASRPIPVGTHVALFLAAHKLASTGESVIDIEEDGCAGRVSTEWNSAAMAEIAGPVFHAEIDTGTGLNSLSYIVRTRDLEEALEEGGPILDLSALLKTATADPRTLN